MQQTINQTKTTKSYPLNEMELAKKLGYLDLHEYRAMFDKSISGLVKHDDWVSLIARPEPVLTKSQYFIDHYNRNGYWLFLLRSQIASSKGLTRQDFLSSVDKNDFNLLRNFFLIAERAQRFRDALSREIELVYQYNEYTLTPNANDSVDLRNIKSVLHDRYQCFQKLEAQLDKFSQLRISNKTEPDEHKANAIAEFKVSIDSYAAELNRLPPVGVTYADFNPSPIYLRARISLEQELMRAKHLALEHFEKFKASVVASGDNNIESLTIENLLDFCIYVATLQGHCSTSMDRMANMPLE
jgi:hypothetical protein